ncbi:MAG TPA: PKD domain-containing protein, partial [Bacteroidia bacterium]|nr:PKD domain-containing protein [Bacteroidia bacterium]
TSQNPPAKTYSTAGTYNVKLVVTTNNGCKDSITKQVTVDVQPVASFTTGNTCRENPATTFNTSTVSSGSITASLWNFGDGNTSSSTNGSHIYSNPGNYTIKLIVTTNNGCQDSTTNNITVYPKPVADFYAPNSSIDDTVQFSDSSTITSGSIVGFYYDFDDGTNSTLQNPKHKYLTYDTFYVSQIVVSDYGCKDTQVNQLIIYPKPGANFNYTNECYGFTTTFTNTSYAPPGQTFVAHHWDFDDGTTSTLQHPTHQYSASGTYDVQLIVTTNTGGKDTVVKTVTVYPKPVADFTINDDKQCYSGHSFSFTNTSTVSSGSIVSYDWNFGDGTTSTSQNPSGKTYSVPDTFDVTLIVTTDNGCKDTIVKQVIVFPQSVADYSINNDKQCLSGNSFSFADLSTVSSGSISAWNWNFGDGGTSTTQNPTHSYTSAGTYTVKLIVTTDNGCQDSVSKSVTVYPQSAADFSINDDKQCLSGNSFSFTDNSTVSSGSITGWSWSFGDGNVSSSQNPTHSYSAAGTYSVKLMVTTDKGCIDSVIKNVVVYPQSTAGFNINDDKQCLSGNSFSFTDISTVSSGSITNWNWTFGDGSNATTQHPTKVYTSAGTYTVKLIVTTNNGCMDSASSSVTVDPQTTVSFSINNDKQCLKGNSFDFTDGSTVSSGSVTGFAWTFGDGSSSTLQNPTGKVYASAGTYDVKLITTTNNGCTDSLTKQINVHPQSSVDFSVANACLDDTLAFTNLSTISGGSIATHYWDFADTYNSTDQHPKHKYAVSGNYNVMLVETTDKGCKDTVVKTLTVYPKPDAVFTHDAGCVNQAINFYNSSSVSSGSITSYLWNMGDGSGAVIVKNPVHLYNSAGNYTVQLIVTSNYSCRDTAVSVVKVTPLPVASFTVNNNCFGDSTVFTNTSTLSSGTMSYIWSFGDGDSSTVQHPKHLYQSSGTYVVTLTVITDNNCTDVFTYNVTIYPKPIVNFTLNDVCYGQNASFNNITYITSGTFTSNWNFGDGSSSTTASPSHYYNADGSYNVTLVATSNFGCKDSTVKSISIYPKPVSAFSATDNCTGKSISFSNTSTVSSGTLTHVWDFGDYTSSTSVNPLHTYTTANTYTVTLISTSDKGCKDTAISTITAYPVPVAGFNASDVCKGTATSFTNTSTISSGTMSYVWTFGDGNSSTSSD